MPSDRPPLTQPTQLIAVPTSIGTTTTALSRAPITPALTAESRHLANGRHADASHLDPAREQLVLINRALVGHIVREVLTRLPSHVDRGDLLSAGFVALTAAAISWQDHRGVPFARYAALRIRGAITDELRAIDWASRGVRSRARTIADARTTLQSTLGRTPTDDELRTATGLSQAELDASAADTIRATVLSLHTPTGAESAAMLPSPAPDPADLLVDRETLGYLDDAIEELPDRLRFVIRGYFFDQRPMAELAAELGVTDSRISQLRAEAVRLLRAGLHEPWHGTPEPTGPDTKTFGPRVVAARQAYIAAVAARSTTTAACGTPPPSPNSPNPTPATPSPCLPRTPRRPRRPRTAPPTTSPSTTPADPTRETLTREKLARRDTGYDSVAAVRSGEQPSHTGTGSAGRRRGTRPASRPISTARAAADHCAAPLHTVIDATPMTEIAATADLDGIELTGPDAATLVIAPLTARGVNVGLIALIRDGQHGFSPDELAAVIDLGVRAGVAVDNARLYAREHDAALNPAMQPTPPPADAGRVRRRRHLPTRPQPGRGRR